MPLLNLAARKIPAKALHNPQIVNTDILTKFMFIPAILAALSLAPIAKVDFPILVFSWTT